MAQETQTGALYQPSGLGWGGRWEGGSRGLYVYLWLIHVGVWQKKTKFCKAFILQLKRNKNGEHGEKERKKKRRDRHDQGNQPWPFNGRSDAKAEAPNTLFTWWEEPTHWKRPWCWERLKVEGEGSERGGDDWMASLTQWTWVWANSGRQWRTGKPGMLLSMGLQSRTWLSDLTTTKSLPACELEMVTTVSNWPSILLGASEDLYGICFRIVHLKDKRREHFYHQWTLTLYSLKE